MATVGIEDEEIVDAIIANPQLIVQAIERLKHHADSLATHHQRWVGIAAGLAKPRRMAGRAAGGYARAASMTQEQRTEQARMAANARWHRDSDTRPKDGDAKQGPTRE